MRHTRIDQDRGQQAGGDGQLEGQDQPGRGQRLTAAAQRAPAEVADEQRRDDDADQVLRVLAVLAPGQALLEACQQRALVGASGGSRIHGRMSHPSAQQGRAAQRYCQQPQPQGNGQPQVGLPVRGQQHGGAETDHRQHDGSGQVTRPEAQAVAHRDPHHHRIHPRQRLTHLDHADRDQAVIGQHSGHPPRIGALRLPQQPTEQQQRKSQSGQHRRQHALVLLQTVQARTGQQHIDQDQRDQHHPHDRLAMFRIRTLRQPTLHACEQVLHVTHPVASMPSSAGRRYPSTAGGRASAHPRCVDRTGGHAGHTDRPVWLPWSMLPCTDGVR